MSNCVKWLKNEERQIFLSGVLDPDHSARTKGRKGKKKREKYIDKFFSFLFALL